jgi:hypothetical protein
MRQPATTLVLHRLIDALPDAALRPLLISLILDGAALPTAATPDSSYREPPGAAESDGSRAASCGDRDARRATAQPPPWRTPVLLPIPIRPRPSAPPAACATTKLDELSARRPPRHRRRPSRDACLPRSG